jgi:hypothetical protein
MGREKLHSPSAECGLNGDIRGFSWLTQSKKESEFKEMRRAFRMEMGGGPLAFFG